MTEIGFGYNCSKINRISCVVMTRVLFLQLNCNGWAGQRTRHFFNH